MAHPISTPPRDPTGQPIAFVDAARSASLDGQWFAYRATGGTWRCIGLFATEATARAAAGLEARP